MRSHLSGLNTTPDLFGNAPPAGATEADQRDCWGTPDALFNWIVAGCGGRLTDHRDTAYQDGAGAWSRGPFKHGVIDLFTSGANTKSPFRIDIDEGDDAFTVDWLTLCYDEECFVTSQAMNQSLRAAGEDALRFGNPPFSRWPQAASKARGESSLHPELDIILIGPGPMGIATNRAGYSYTNTHGKADAVLFLVPRVNFIAPPGIEASQASGPTTVLAYGPAARAFVARRGGNRTEYDVEWK